MRSCHPLWVASLKLMMSSCTPVLSMNWRSERSRTTVAWARELLQAAVQAVGDREVELTGEREVDSATFVALLVHLETGSIERVGRGVAAVHRWPGRGRGPRDIAVRGPRPFSLEDFQMVVREIRRALGPGRRC